MKISDDLKFKAGIGLLVSGVLLWLIFRPGAAAKAGAQVGESVGDVLTGAYTGTMHSVLGVPYVDHDKCKQDQAEGRTFAAMSSCSIGDFFGGLFGGDQTQTSKRIGATATY